MRISFRCQLVLLMLAFTTHQAARADDFRVTTATYLGGGSPTEQWAAVDIAQDKTIVLAGAAAELSVKGAARAELLGGGEGVIVRLNAEGAKILSITRVGDYVEDMKIGPGGRIAVAGSFGVAVLSPDAAKVLWSDKEIILGTKAAQFSNQTPPFREDRYTRRLARVAIGSDGTTASIQNAVKKHGSEPKRGRLYIWDKEGKRLSDVPLTDYKYPQDVCVDTANRLVIVGGFNTYAAESRHMKRHPIHMPWMAAYAYEGRRKWEAYNFPAKDVYAQNTFADSRVQRLAIGGDGRLYMGGYIHGGDFVWRHDPFDVKKRVNVDTGFDAFSKAYNMGRGIDMAYFAKFEPATGRILQGQALLTRATEQGGGKPAQIQIQGIDADKNGNLYLSGYAEAFIENRSQKQINGKSVGDYFKPEAFLMVVSHDFKTRKVWTVFSEKAESASWGVAQRDGLAALIAEVYEGAMITTSNALQKKPARTTDGYMVVWEAEK